MSPLTARGDPEVPLVGGAEIVLIRIAKGKGDLLDAFSFSKKRACVLHFKLPVVAHGPHARVAEEELFERGGTGSAEGGKLGHPQVALHAFLHDGNGF